MFILSKLLRVSIVILALLTILVNVQQAESKKLLKLAAAAAILRGGPIIPLPIRYPVHTPRSQVTFVKQVKEDWDQGWQQSGHQGGWEGSLGETGWW